ncbi:MAG: hypothetical protein WDN04_11160 [Rhodospirillales bacterium]
MTAAYVAAVTTSYPSITAVWLIGSRANDSVRTSSDWDYLAFADKATLEALMSDLAFNVSTVDLMIVFDGNNFRKPWAEDDRVKGGSLTDWQWTPVTESVAHYRATRAIDGEHFNVEVQIARALRIYPR